MTTDQTNQTQHVHHASIAILSSQMTTVLTQIGELKAAQAAEARKSEAAHAAIVERVTSLEALVRGGGFAVRIVGWIGAGIVALFGLWPAIREWMKWQVE